MSKRSEHELRRLIEEAVSFECSLAERGLWFCVDALEVRGHPPEHILGWATVHFLPAGSPFCCGEVECALRSIPPWEWEQRIGERLRAAMGLRQNVRVDFGYNFPGGHGHCEPRIRVNYHDGVEFLYQSHHDIDWFGVIDALKEKGVEFGPGLAAAEIQEAEARFQLLFPPDLKGFLQTALPCGPGFPDWRLANPGSLQEQLDWPAEGICYDVEHSGFWLDSWGARPLSLSAAIERVREIVSAAPPLVPLFGHRYIPSRPNLVFNPVFSVYQTDIITYGYHLPDYFANEFGVESPIARPKNIRPIKFWGEF